MRSLRAFQLAALFALAVSTPVSTAASGENRLEVRESKFELFVHDAAESTAFYAILGFGVAHAKHGGYTTLRSNSTVIALSPLPWWLPIH